MSEKHGEDNSTGQVAKNYFPIARVMEPTVLLDTSTYNQSESIRKNQKKDKKILTVWPKDL